MNALLNERVEKIADAIAREGHYVGTSIFNDALTRQLCARVGSLGRAGEFTQTRIGRANEATANAAIRGDQTMWLSDAPEHSAEKAAISVIAELRQALNYALFLGASSEEMHFAHYPPGRFYKRHRDQFATDDARVLSLVFYLNESWPNDAGGELVLYDEALNEISRVLPRAGTMVAFRSEMFPHEVLPASLDRYSLTGWLRRR